MVRLHLASGKEIFVEGFLRRLFLIRGTILTFAFIPVPFFDIHIIEYALQSCPNRISSREPGMLVSLLVLRTFLPFLSPPLSNPSSPIRH